MQFMCIYGTHVESFMFTHSVPRRGKLIDPFLSTMFNRIPPYIAQYTACEYKVASSWFGIQISRPVNAVSSVGGGKHTYTWQVCWGTMVWDCQTKSYGLAWVGHGHELGVHPSSKSD